MDLLADQIGEVLHPLYADPGDSGIDSDGNEQLAEALQRFMAFVDRGRDAAAESASEASSSGDEAEPPAPAPNPQHWSTYFNKSKDDDFLKAMEDGRINPLEVNWPMGHRQPDLRQLYGDAPFEEHRASPPLYEVELTASDEDDDGSVLELVIPMQPSRYKRVPTTSPKKHANPKKPNRSSAYGIFCCMTCLPNFG